MKVAFISDIHGNMEALEAVLRDIETRDIHYIYCLGDLVGYGPDPNPVVDAIREHQIPTVMGNFDDAIGFIKGSCGCTYQPGRETEMGEFVLNWSIENTSEDSKTFLRALPKELQTEIGGVAFHLVHGSPANHLLEYLRPNTPISRLEEIIPLIEGDVLVSGHTHLPLARVYKGKGIFNCGSVGRPKDGDPRAAYLVFEADQGTYSFECVRVPYHIQTVCEKLALLGLPPELGTVLALGKTYDMGLSKSGERVLHDFQVT